MAGLKEMAPAFWVFNRTTYFKLIPDHISDLKRFPPEVLHSFMQDSFSELLVLNLLNVFHMLHWMRLTKWGLIKEQNN